MHITASYNYNVFRILDVLDGAIAHIVVCRKVYLDGKMIIAWTRETHVREI